MSYFNSGQNSKKSSKPVTDRNIWTGEGKGARDGERSFQAGKQMPASFRNSNNEVLEQFMINERNLNFYPP